MKFLLLFAISLLSCVNTMTLKDFNEQLSLRWIGIFNIQSLHPYLKSNELVIRPKGVWQYLFTINFYDQDFKVVSDCVYYKVPYEDDGVLAIEYDQSVCKKSPSKIDLKVENIMSFKFNIDKSDKKINKIELFLNDAIYKYDVINFYDHIPSEIKISSPIKTLHEKTKKIIEDGKVCQTVNENCEQSKSKCHECKNGWHLEISSSCPVSYSKVCGIIDCGKRSMPACIRGFISSRVLKNYCINDSPVGFCDKGLRVYCEDKKLICR